MTKTKTRTVMKIKSGLNIKQNKKITSQSRAIENPYVHTLTFGYANSDQKLAMDSNLQDGMFGQIPNMRSAGLNYGFAPEFLGYATLSNLMQNALIRAGVETLADEMISGWIKLSRTGNDDNDIEENGKIAELNQEFEKYNIKDVLHKAAEYCGYFGGGLVYIDTGEKNEDLINPLKIDPTTFGKDKLIKFVPIEPINIAPGLYNCNDPLKSDYFKPSTWWILGKEVHASRFLYFKINEPPMILKPSYNFFGIPTAQLALDYCLHFTADRESASRLLNKYSLTIFKTNMADLLAGTAGLENIDRRIQIFTSYRDNDSVSAIDKEEEDIVQINTPIGGVTDIVRQGLELLAVVFRMPAVKLLGISPSGFNATGQSDMDNWHEHVLSQSNKIFKKPLHKLIKILQLNKYGEIDDSIIFNFNPIGKEDKQIEASTNKTKADTNKLYVDMGALSPMEVRISLATDPDSGYNINPDELPEEEEDDGDFMLSGASDEDFKDDDHPRDNDGKFASGSSSNSKNKNKKKEQITSSVAFGKAYTDYSGKPKEAIDKLLNEKQGHVPAAIYKEGIGDIDFVYGNDDYGLVHIIKRRNAEGLDGEAFVKELPEIIKRGEIDIKDKVFGRIYIIILKEQVFV